MRSYILVLLLAAAVLPCSAAAQRADTVRLSIEDAVVRAERQADVAQTATLQLDITEAQLDIARARDEDVSPEEYQAYAKRLAALASVVLVGGAAGVTGRGTPKWAIETDGSTPSATCPSSRSSPVAASSTRRPRWHARPSRRAS